MDEAASLAVGAGPGHPESAADLCLVLGMAGYFSQLLFPMGELALGTIAAAARLAPAAAKLRLVQPELTVVCTGTSDG